MVFLPDPKPTPQFRNYEENPTTDHQRRVKDFYYKQHRFQTVDFVAEMVRSCHIFINTNNSRLLSNDSLISAFMNLDIKLYKTINSLNLFDFSIYNNKLTLIS